MPGILRRMVATFYGARSSSSSAFMQAVSPEAERLHAREYRAEQDADRALGALRTEREKWSVHAPDPKLDIGHHGHAV